MPVCELCDGESFYDKDGWFYCTNCNTQSQDTRVEMKQEISKSEVTFDTATNLGLKEKRKRRNPGPKRSIYDMGKPWLAFEGFQYMIKAQVEALVAMGYNGKLKDCVRSIWFHYLKVRKIAFYDEEPKHINLQEHSERTYSEAKLPPQVKQYRHFDENQVGVMNAKKKKQDDDLLDKNLKTDELDKLSHPSDEEMINSDDKESGDEGGDKKKCCGSIGSFQLRSEAYSAVSKSLKYKQCYSLFFCYLGLNLLEEPVFLSDLIRWSDEGMIPYHKANKVLPSAMKFGGQDCFCFTRGTKLYLSSNTTGKFVHLCNALNIEPSPGKEYFKVMAMSVVVDFEFSSSVLSLVWYLIDLDFDKNGPPSAFIMDCTVFAYIIIAVKLIYYLDDHHELGNVVRSSLLDTLNLPPVESWKRWVTRTMIKQKKKLYNGIPKDEEDLKYIRDLSLYEDYCMKDPFDDFRPRPTSLPYRHSFGKWRLAAGSQGPKAQYRGQFLPVAQILNPAMDLNNITRVPTNFPLSVDHAGNVIRGDGYNHSSCNHDDVMYTYEQVEKGACTANTNSNVALNDENNFTSGEGSSVISKDDTPMSVLHSHSDNIDNTPVLHPRSDNLKKQVPDEMNNNEHNSVPNKSSSCDEDTKYSDQYIYYAKEPEAEGEDKNAWSDSYRYLIAVFSRRMEMYPSRIQHYVRKRECCLFGK